MILIFSLFAQCAYGDPGLNYTFSGVTLPAQPWPKFLSEIGDKISELTGYRFNFVLINRLDSRSIHYQDCCNIYK